LNAPLADIELVKRVVVEAGKRALSHWGQVAFEYKADTSLVTAVDRDTERAIEEALGREYPGFAFLGEEYGRRGPENAPTWACDPIDGTTNFVHGLGYWCVSVGLLHGNTPQLGAIYLPVLDELYWGVRGQGAWCNGRPLHARDTDEVDAEETMIFTSSAAKALNTEVIAARIRCLGSIASEVAQVARGSARGVTGTSEGIIDMAAGLCIAGEAGCEMRYLSGRSVDIGEWLITLRTTEPFALAPPRVLKMLLGSLHTR
jgi:myo-inositol-1(or 4)-monophosphatase